MSSGYSSLEEDSEDYFFTARTSFFKKPSGKLTESKVQIILLALVTRTCVCIKYPQIAVSQGRTV